MKCMKYIVMVIDGKEEIFLFPMSIDHDKFHEGITAIRFGSDRAWARKLRGEYPISAGFVEGGVCYGRSETLNLDSRPQVDSKLLY
jgi:hypothetical protein